MTMNTTHKQRATVRATLRSLLTSMDPRDVDAAARLLYRGHGLTFGDAVHAVSGLRSYNGTDHLAAREPGYIVRLMAERDACTTDRARESVVVQAKRWACGLFWRYGCTTAYVGLPGGAGWAEHHAWLRRIGDEAA
jgi:hypothetical protein